MSRFRSRSGIVNVRMVITEEKMLSNIDKIQKLINPKSKKQIVQLEDDSYFKDLIESIKAYLIEYPKKKNFPASVYKAAYGLVEFATNQFEENTKKVEDLIRQREKNIKLANVLNDVLQAVKSNPKNAKEIIKKVKKKYTEDVVEALKIISTTEENSEEFTNAEQLILAKIGNLESNMFIEIDMERIEDRSKALSYIGIEIAEALKYIPAPLIAEDNTITSETQTISQEEVTTPSTELLQDVMIEKNSESVLDIADSFFEETRFETKPTFWQRLKNSKLIRTLKFILQIKVVLDYPALPEGRGE